MPTAREPNVGAPAERSYGVELKLEQPIASPARHGASQRLTVRDATEDQLDHLENLRRSREDCDRADRWFFWMSVIVVIFLTALTRALAQLS